MSLGLFDLEPQIKTIQAVHQIYIFFCLYFFVLGDSIKNIASNWKLLTGGGQIPGLKCPISERMIWFQRAI